MKSQLKQETKKSFELGFSMKLMRVVIIRFMSGLVFDL